MVERTGRRADVFSKVTGQAQYANDMYYKNMLYIKVIRSSYPHAKIKSIEKTVAENYPGVVKVITAEDIPGIVCQPMEKPILASGFVRSIGEGVALVVSESEEVAEEAAKLVKIDYEVLPAVFTPEEALYENAPKLYKEGNLLCHFNAGKGDVISGFNEADFIIEREYNTQRVQHVAIEPESALAVPGIDEITVYVATNDPFNARRVITETLGVDATEIRVVLPTIGGSFGGKSYDNWVLGSRTALAAKITKRPCKATYTREESIIEGTKRHPYKIKYKVGVTKAGKITAIEVDILGDGGAYRSKSPFVASRSCVEAVGCYEVSNVKSSITLAYTNNVYSDALRGFGSPQVAFSSEVLMDEIAKELNIDPIEFRKQNSFKENSVSGVGQTMTQVSLQECFNKALDASDWEKRKAQILSERKDDDKKVRGLGIALLHRGEAFGAGGQGLDASAVSMHVQKDGSVMILTSMSEVGNGCHNMLRKVVSEALSLKIEKIKVRTVDTGYVPDSGATVATRGTFIIGNAMRDAAEKVRKKIISMAAKKLGVLEDKVILKDEYVYSVDDTERKISYFSIINDIYASGDHAYAHGWHVVNGLKWDKEKGQGDAYQSYAYGACVAEVEVDLETGEVKVEKIIAVHDVGHAFDKEEVIGQINGGVSMGVGYGILEEVEIKDGVVKNINFEDYLIPTAVDMPDMTSIVVESPSNFGPYGARGLGEPTACSAAPAIVNAIADATGFYIRDIPASLEKVLVEARKHIN